MTSESQNNVTATVTAVPQVGVPNNNNIFYLYAGKHYSSKYSAQRAHIADLCKVFNVNEVNTRQLVDILPHLLDRLVDIETVNLFKSNNGKYFKTANEVVTYESCQELAQATPPVVAPVQPLPVTLPVPTIINMATEVEVL